MSETEFVVDAFRAADGSDQVENKPQTSLSTGTTQPAVKPTISWTAQAPTFSVASSVPSAYTQFSTYSPATTEILKRLHASHSNATGTPAFEAKRAEVLQNYKTSDKLQTPPPAPPIPRKARGGKASTPGTTKAEGGASSSVSTPASGRGRGSGRGKARGRGGARGGAKRKRAESADSDEESDISSSYTPLPTRTKSGRNVNKPVAFVPTLPEPTPAVKRRRSTKTILAAQCKTCHRGTDPENNRIVFCDVCTTAYHQYCHDPPIENEVVNVLEKEWLCGPCHRSKQNVLEGTEDLAAVEGLSIEDKRTYFTSLPPHRLVELLLHAIIRHPELPIFPANVQDIIPNLPKSTLAPLQPTTTKPALQTPLKSTTKSPVNGHVIASSSSAKSQNIAIEVIPDPISASVPAQSHDQNTIPPQIAPIVSKPHDSAAATTHPPQSLTTDLSAAEISESNPTMEHIDEYDDGYDTDPPAHYPKAGNGLARTLRPEAEDLQWLVDDNFEAFSHGWKGDGSGLGADGILSLDGVEGGK